MTKLTNLQIEYIIKAVDDWNRQHIDFIDLKDKLQNCIKWS